MHKKSITCFDNDNQSSRIELSNPAVQDIVATNHIVLRKEFAAGRVSRLCKAAICILILGLLTIGIVTLTLVLAHSRNNWMTTLARSAETNRSVIMNESRTLFINEENLTTSVDERKKDNWQTSTVTLTSDHFDRLSSEPVHISSMIMRTKQSNEHTSSNVPTMKPYPSSNTIVNEQSSSSSTISTTVQTTPTTTTSRDSQPTGNQSETITMTEDEFITNTENNHIEMDNHSISTMVDIHTSDDDEQSSSTHPITSSMSSTTSISNQDESTSTLTNLLSIEPFTAKANIVDVSTISSNRRKKISRKRPTDDDDILNDLLFF